MRELRPFLEKIKRKNNPNDVKITCDGHELSSAWFLNWLKEGSSLISCKNLNFSN